MPARGFWILRAGGGQTSVKGFRECAKGNWRCKSSNFSVETYLPSKFKFKLTCVGCDSMVSSPLYFSSWDLYFLSATGEQGPDKHVEPTCRRSRRQHEEYCSWDLA
jgi:hypothetical protein